MRKNEKHLVQVGGRLGNTETQEPSHERTSFIRADRT